ncbi:MAG TPA: DUF2891 domain-containing protein [Fimbriimonadaceae bacterium]|nr:DUF2891 domain-containing protein [Fimbriimonadaceae bacterium]
MDALTLTIEQANSFAGLPLASIHREYPNAPGYLLLGPESLRPPHQAHPAFYGCLDWHSAVHGHWMLVRLLRLFELERAAPIRASLSRSLTAENLAAEAAYFEKHPTFERMYGWAWLLKLCQELREWDDPDAARWSQNLAPLERVIVDSYRAFLPKQTYAIRVGTHGNTAFGLTFALDYARFVGDVELAGLIEARARDYFLGDRDRPGAARFEPGGNDFFSPTLMEADLMRRVLGDEFAAWYRSFLLDLSPFASPAIVSDRSDPQIAHLDGLNLSRAWCLKGIGRDLGDAELLRLAELHAQAGIAHVASGHYEGEHWLGSFAVYMGT